MKELSIITYFLNEGEEVYNTLFDLHRHGDLSCCEIIVINDASDDGIDYDSIVGQFRDVRYYHNSRRKGVAACRDMGVELCRTPYFIMVDCHVRFIGHTWINEIIKALKEEPGALLCCQTRFLRKHDGRLQTEYAPVCGAYIDFGDPKLGCHWRKPTEDDRKAGDRVPIPCVLGSCYACSKSYWQNIGGLKGLRSYGLDEQYISMKVWLSGGCCLLLRHTPIAHIYRCGCAVPYHSPSADYYYNILLIIETLFPEEKKNVYWKQLRQNNEMLFFKAMSLIAREWSMIERLKQQYETMRKVDFQYITAMNKPSL